MILENTYLCKRHKIQIESSIGIFFFSSPEKLSSLTLLYHYVIGQPAGEAWLGCGIKLLTLCASLDIFSLNYLKCLIV